MNQAMNCMINEKYVWREWFSKDNGIRCSFSSFLLNSFGVDPVVGSGSYFVHLGIFWQEIIRSPHQLLGLFSGTGDVSGTNRFRFRDLFLRSYIMSCLQQDV